MKKIYLLVSILLLTQMIIGQTIVDYDQTWTIDQIYDGDIIIKSGVTLTVDGARVGMKKAKSIIVENNAKLISQEGKFDYAYATSYEDSQEKWFGIKMQDGSSLEMYASTLNNAQQAIRLDGDGDILLRNNVYFNHDLTGMKLNMIDYNNSNIVVDVYCSFFDCTTGIDLFGNFEKFEVTRWVSFYNCTNAIQIYKDWDDDNGNEPLISEADFHNCDYGIYCAYSGFKVENCSFDDGETAIDIEDADGVELIHNTFNDQSFAGLASYGSNFFMHDENSFHYCNTGVLAMDSYSNSQFSITDQNYFGFCGTAIDVSGVDGAKNFEIIDNILEYNEFGIFAEGSNHFDIQVNELYTNDYNININRSGDQKNNVGCNEVSNSWNGLQIHYFNDMTDFIGNNFVDLTTDDVILRESTLNQNIGDNLYPAMNSFGPNSLDILNLNSDKFKYWIPKNAPDNLDPEGIPESWKYHSDFETTNKCELPVNIPDDIDDVTINEWKEEFCYYWEIYKYNPDNELAKELYYKYKGLLGKYYTILYSKVNHIDVTWNHIIEYLKRICDHYYFQKRLYSVYLMTGDCIRADSVLNAIELSLGEPALNNPVDSLDRAMKRSFVDIQRIVSRYTCAKRDAQQRETFEFGQDDINTLYQEAQKKLPESGYARALYYMATKELLPNDDYVEMHAQKAQKLLSKSGIENTNTFNLYPNPAKEEVFIEYSVDKNVNANVQVFDVYGNKILNKRVELISNNRLSLNISKFNPGVYLINIVDDKGNTLKNEKILVESINK